MSWNSGSPSQGRLWASLKMPLWKPAQFDAGSLAGNFAEHIVGLLVVVILFAALIGTFVSQVQTTLAASNAVKTAWNFTGAAAAQTIFGLTPLFVIIGIVLLIIGIAFHKIEF